LLVGRDLESEQRVRALGPEADLRRLGQLTLDVDLAGPARVGELDEQLGREARGVLGEVRVDALLPAVRAVRPEREPLGAAKNRDRLEVRRLEEDIGRGLVDLAVLRAHDPGDRHGLLGIGDHQVALVEFSLGAVERADRLAAAGASDDDLAAGELPPVERVQRVAERVHDVVRHVDHVRDRAQARGDQPRFQPGRRGTDADLAEEPADVARGALGIFDDDGDVFVSVTPGVRPRPWLEGAVEERRHLAGDAVDPKQVGTVRRRLQLQHRLAQRQHVGERRPRLRPVVEDDDAAVVWTELELPLGEDHPARDLAA
jgi:hypothetical protein